MSLKQEHWELQQQAANLDRQLSQVRSLLNQQHVSFTHPGSGAFASLETGWQNSEELFRAYIETANDMVYVVDLAGTLTYINAYGQRLLACEEGWWRGRSYLEFVAPNCRQETAQAFAQLLIAGELKDFEFMLQPLSGDPIHMEVNGCLLYRQGKPIGGLGIARDITERKRFENQLQMFEKAVESAYDSAAIVDLEGKIMYANSATSRMFDYEPGKLVGNNAAIFYPEDSKVWLEWVLQQVCRPSVGVAANGSPPASGWSGEVICQRRGGEHFPALVSVSPIPNDRGQTTAVSVICRDITTQKATQAELAAKNLELERAGRLKSEFLANMSHELRTPLTSILGFSSLLTQEIFGELNSKQMVYVQRIHDSGEHLLKLIEDVLDLSKVEAGKVKLDIVPISVPQVCETTLALVSEQAAARDIKIQTAIQPDLAPLMADELRVRQMLINLLSNALKFTPSGSTIGLEASARAGYLHLVVWDRGIGIPKDKQALLFKPFQQIENTLRRSHEGTGLGLALTRQLAELHGGTVECESTPGKGSRFTISLPLNLHHAASLDSVEPQLPETPMEASQAPERRTLLLVEDRQDNAMLLRDILQYWGYDVHHVADGETALDWLSAHRPDLILMDIQLPGLDGLEVTRRIKAHPTWKSIPVVATTALVMMGDRDRCLKAGVDDYLSKPVNCEQLAVVLARHLQSGSRNRSQASNNAL
ncbi:MAG TPA: PAS domain S-box protein [Oscillatoriales cyanobacterium M59_W2019_021]|nr:MAG: PAS domain S-box protein [Cyanobacteria bacterium J055]HIK51391.1 PAS domain S-box protein [Oscillatoriales cyanobacterium M59_W2019_021]